MEEIQTTLPAWVEVNFNAFEQALNGDKGKPLHKLRRAALERVKALGFPSSRDERWKYTNITPHASKDYQFSGQSGCAAPELADIKQYLLAGESSSRVVFVDGKFCGDLSLISALPAGLTVSTFNECFEGKAGQQIVNAFQARIGDSSVSTDQSFVALNTAFLQDGIFVHLDKNCTVQVPLQIIFITSSRESVNFVTPRVLIAAEKNSQAQIVETHVGNGEYFSSAFCEIDLAENAKIDLVKIELESSSALHVGNTLIRQEQSSTCAVNLFSFGGKLVRNEVRVVLAGKNCNTVLNGLTVIKDDQHVDNHTVLDHAQPHCESNEQIKGIYAGKSKGVFNGTIIVRPDAQKTNAIQSNKSLLLSKDATIDTQPQLKIWADDVKCTHGATVGQLDENSMFYLRSRGIDKITARNLLVRAFAADLISAQSNAAIREHLDVLLLKRLEEIEHEN